MKKLIVLIMFLFATNLYSACCLTPLYDSLYQLDFKKGENIPIWGTLPFDLIKCKYEPRCDIVIICWENAVVGKWTWAGKSYGNAKLYISFTYIANPYKTGYIIYPITSYTLTNYKDSILYRSFQTINNYDTVLNYCSQTSIESDSISVETMKDNYKDEKILSVLAYDIRGRLVAIRNDSKFNDLQGFYVFRYITDKRTYSQKKYFIK